jgi:uncharacterized membrane protein
MPASQYTSHSDTQPTELSALDILHQRYARGEIDTLTYDEMRERLSAGLRPRE